MMVVAVLGVAAIMSYVMLSSATLANSAGRNQSKVAAAECAVESGVNIAMYYLQYPDRAPSRNASGYWAGTVSDLDLGDHARVGVSVTRDASDDQVYEIVSVANVGTSADPIITRTSGARVYVRKEWDVSKAAAFNYDAQISSNTTVQGDIWTSRNLALRTGTPNPIVQGAGYCKTSTSGVLYVTPQSGFKLATPASPGAPLVAEVSTYQTYRYGSASKNAATLPDAILATGTTLNPTPSNPAGVYYAAGALQIADNVTINGTLVVNNTLSIRGTNIVITPQTGYPALIVTGALDIDRTLKSLTVNGTCYIGTQLRASGTTPVLANMSTFTVNGGLLVGPDASAPIPTSGYNIKTVLKYDSAKAKPVALSKPRGVSVLRWGLP